MADPERRGNILARATGIAAYRNWRDFYLNRGETPQSSRRIGIILGVGHFVTPLCSGLDLRRRTMEKDEIQAWKALPLIHADAFFDIGFVLLAFNNPLVAVGFKVGYNFVVEAAQKEIPYALRAVKRWLYPTAGNGNAII